MEFHRTSQPLTQSADGREHQGGVLEFVEAPGEDDAESSGVIGEGLRLEYLGIHPGPERVDLFTSPRIGVLEPFRDERIDAKELLAHRHRETFAGIVNKGILFQQRVHLQFWCAFAVQHLYER